MPDFASIVASIIAVIASVDATITLNNRNGGLVVMGGEMIFVPFVYTDGKEHPARFLELGDLGTVPPVLYSSADVITKVLTTDFSHVTQ
jgi:hypothetical protein